jgi:hypothetical protein
MAAPDRVSSIADNHPAIRPAGYAFIGKNRTQWLQDGKPSCKSIENIMKRHDENIAL